MEKGEKRIKGALNFFFRIKVFCVEIFKIIWYNNTVQTINFLKGKDKW
jgi:hypothetical protein